jgi:RHS repeat-associated protein
MAALSVIYSNFCGMVVSETRSGVESDYISDPLGSTIGLMGSTGTMTDRWEYWPWGEVVSRTGTNATPLTFLGVLGYFKDVIDKLFYVRARHFRADLARWLTADPTWPKQPEFSYSANAPILIVDPSGLDYCDIQNQRCVGVATTAMGICLLAATIAFGFLYLMAQNCSKLALINLEAGADCWLLFYLLAAIVTILVVACFIAYMLMLNYCSTCQCKCELTSPTPDPMYKLKCKQWPWQSANCSWYGA